MFGLRIQREKAYLYVSYAWCLWSI